MGPISANHRDINWFERLILAGRDPDEKIDMLDHARLQWGMVIAAVVVTLFIGFLVYAGQSYIHDQCVKRNAASVLSRQVLSQLVDASNADRDQNQARVWKAWLKVSQATLPKC